MITLDEGVNPSDDSRAVSRYTSSGSVARIRVQERDGYRYCEGDTVHCCPRLRSSRSRAANDLHSKDHRVLLQSQLLQIVLPKLLSMPPVPQKPMAGFCSEPGRTISQAKERRSRLIRGLLYLGSWLRITEPFLAEDEANHRKKGCRSN